MSPATRKVACRSVLSRICTIFTASLLAAALLAACGGGDDESDRAPRETLRDTFQRMESVDSGRIDIDVSIRGGDQRVRAGVGGVFAEGRRGDLPRFDFDLTTREGSAGRAISAGVTSTGDRGFVELAGAAYELDDQTFRTISRLYASSGTDDGNDRTFEDLGVDPERWLTGLRNEGTEDVSGAETVHISGRLDVRRFFADIRRLRNRLGELSVPGAEGLPGLSDPDELEEFVSSARFDLYTETGDLLLRRLRAVLRLRDPTGESSETLEMNLDLRLDELGEPQEIEAPSNAQPFRELLDRIGGLGELLPGSSGEEGTGSDGTSTDGTSEGDGPPGGLSRERARRYLECIREAQDQADLRRCSQGLR